MNEPGSPAAGRLVWTVAGLLLATGDALAARFGAVTVRGELSGYARASSGHCYFTLKDADGAGAVLRCALFRRAALLLDFTPADGLQVEVRGRLAVYEARGELQMVVESLQRLGAGTLYEEFLRRRARLEAQGLFDPAKKRALPRFPAAVGVVTSLKAAALHDVLTALRRRAPQVPVVIYPAAVQGADAPAALVAALRQAGQRREVDVLLLVRGGGSLEDLWAFNDEQVVQAVSTSPMPVVCGVGHETDFSLCDLAADLRAATPTAAAELAAPARADLSAALEVREAVMHRAVERVLQNAAQRVDQLGSRLGQPARGLSGQRQAASSLGLRLHRALAMRLQRHVDSLPLHAQRLQRALSDPLRMQQRRLQAVDQQLRAHDPRQVLRRGYAWVQAQDGRPVLSAASLQPGQSVWAVWSDGRALADVRTVDLTAAPSTGSLPTMDSHPDITTQHED